MIDPTEVVDEIWQDPSGRVAYVQAYNLDENGNPIVTFGGNSWVDYPPGDGWTRLRPPMEPA